MVAPVALIAPVALVTPMTLVVSVVLEFHVALVAPVASRVVSIDRGRPPQLSSVGAVAACNS